MKTCTDLSKDLFLKSRSRKEEGRALWAWEETNEMSKREAEQWTQYTMHTQRSQDFYFILFLDAVFVALENVLELALEDLGGLETAMFL